MSTLSSADLAFWQRRENYRKSENCEHKKRSEVLNVCSTANMRAVTFGKLDYSFSFASRVLSEEAIHALSNGATPEFVSSILGLTYSEILHYQQEAAKLTPQVTQGYHELKGGNMTFVPREQSPVTSEQTCPSKKPVLTLQEQKAQYAATLAQIRKCKSLITELEVAHERNPLDDTKRSSAEIHSELTTILGNIVQ